MTRSSTALVVPVECQGEAVESRMGLVDTLADKLQEDALAQPEAERRKAWVWRPEGRTPGRALDGDCNRRLDSRPAPEWPCPSWAARLGAEFRWGGGRSRPVARTPSVRYPSPCCFSALA